MRMLYRNFEGLDVSFQGALPAGVIAELEQARMAAQEARGPVLVTLGTVQGEVAESGARGGYAIAATLKAMRYTMPTTDSNRSRWPMHPLWHRAVAAAQDALAPYTSKADRGKVMQGIREQIINARRKHLVGSVVGLTTVMGLDVSELPATLDLLEKDIGDIVRKDRAAVQEKYRKTMERMGTLR